MSEAHDRWLDRYAAELREKRLGGAPVACIGCGRLTRPTVCPACGAFNAHVTPALQLRNLILIDAQRLDSNR